jgi:hypothetical protein
LPPPPTPPPCLNSTVARYSPRFPALPRSTLAHSTPGFSR